MIYGPIDSVTFKGMATFLQAYFPIFFHSQSGNKITDSTTRLNISSIPVGNGSIPNFFNH